ncbi:MAG: Trp operon repressor [Sphingobacteriales bacterium]|jgi:Trp operon repressor
MTELLLQILTKATSEAEFKKILAITLTEKELEMVEERWQIFAAYKNNDSQREAAKHANCSIVTATRGAKVYRDDQKFIGKMLSRIESDVVNTK